jgi:DNA-binding beta-propeller fold protein YncE
MFSTNSVLKINRLIVGILCLYLASCTPEDDKPKPAEEIKYTSGVFIINEGNTVGGSLSFFSRVTSATVQNDVFEKANGGLTLGNGLQYGSFLTKSAYFITSKSNNVTVVNPVDFKTITTITGFEQPRYIINIGGRAFISQWGNNGLNGSIQVIDTVTNKITSSFATGKGPERLEYINGLLWVLNSGGAGKDSTIQQFFLAGNKDSLIKTISVPLCPKDIIKDANGDIWILCSGYPDRAESGKLVKLRDDQVQFSFDVPKGADKLIKDKTGNILYFIADNKIWQKDLLNFGKTPPSVFTGIKKTFQNLTAIGIDTDTENFYCADALDSKTGGTVYIFNKTTFDEKTNFKVGVKPIAFVFK